MGDTVEVGAGTLIRFGSFSLGDVFEREIKRLGRFAFREKHSTGKAAAKFEEEFIRLQHETSENLDRAEDFAGLQVEKEGNLGDQNVKVAFNRADPGSLSKPRFPFGTCINHLFAHSWSDPVGSWVWVRKGATLEAGELGLGFPARKDEIHKFGYKSRRVVRVASRTTDERSFAEVATMDLGRGRGQLKRGGMAPRMGGRGGQGDQVRIGEMKSSRGNHGIESGTPKKLKKRGHMDSTTAALLPRVDSGRTDQGLSNKE
jgi:hypothetical protein